MTRLTVTRAVKADIADTLDYLEREAGEPTAFKYASRIEQAVERLIHFPESGAPRPVLGEFTRIVIIEPFLLFYDYEPAGDLLTLLRFVHGKTDVKEESLRRS